LEVSRLSLGGVSINDGSGNLRIIRDVGVAKETLLKRCPFEHYDTSSGVGGRVGEISGEELTPEQVVKEIIIQVRDRGDVALLEYSKKIDGTELERLEVTRREIDEACDNADRELVSALSLAADRIRSFHLACQRNGVRSFSENGLGQLVYPLKRVGIYVPGGTASYPSTMLMTAIPAMVAGVDEVIVATPPRRGESVEIFTLVAARIAGVDRIFKLGGAQAIAAMAFGTESVPRVDKICGPGNIFVTLAKKMLYGTVGIDGLYGPTETVIIADDTADPAICAVDLLAQAEHDVLASAILITTSEDMAQRVSQEAERQLDRMERREIATESLRNRGGVIVVADMEEAIELVNFYAPEHLALMVRDGGALVGKIKNAGGIFVGEWSSEVLGDYVAGPSHVMPTGGSARFSSALSVSDFVKISNLVALDRESLKELNRGAAIIARAEGLGAHAAAAEARLR